MAFVAEKNERRVRQLFSDVVLPTDQPDPAHDVFASGVYRAGRGQDLQLPLFGMFDRQIFRFTPRIPSLFEEPVSPGKAQAVVPDTAATAQYLLPTFYPDGRYFVHVRPYHVAHREKTARQRHPSLTDIFTHDPPPSVVRYAGRLAGALADGLLYIPKESRRLKRISMARSWIFHEVNPVQAHLGLRLRMRHDRRTRVYPVGNLSTEEWKRLMRQVRGNAFRPIPEITQLALNLFHEANRRRR